ncbi:MAG: hypothetical protein K2J77_07330 [Oscillospiraceae bacterium]|nr:hypothetical protein [Oscillospiraceae bacterium]
MKTSVYLVLKYWRKHKKNLIALIFSGVLLAAMIFVLLILRREYSVRRLDSCRDSWGAFDLIIVNSNDELLAKVTEGKTGYTYGSLDVVGEMGNEANRFLVGVLHDEHNLYHIPLSEGRLPETSTEIALDTNTIKALFWVGKCGETITLDGETYTITGIIDNEKIDRLGWQNDTHVVDFSHYLPPIFIGESDKTPLYRADFFGDYYYGELLPGMDERLKNVDQESTYTDYLRNNIEFDDKGYGCNWDLNAGFSWLTEYGDNTNFILFTAYIGIAVAVLSVFSVMKSVFSERAAWISTLKRIGAGRGVLAKFYAAECAFFTIIQTAVGLLAGLLSYGVILAYKVNVLGEKPFSGFTTNFIITNNTRDPFLYAVICSIAVFVPAYLLCVLTSKLRAKKLRKQEKPRSLWRCFGRAFARGSVTVVQTAALALIFFSVIMTYLYYTRNGKDEPLMFLSMPLEIDNYYAGGIDLNKEGLAEYYYVSPPALNGVGHQDKDSTQHLFFINPDDTKGFGDDTAAKLPEGTVSMGEMGYLFIELDEPNSTYGKEIDLSNQIVRDLLLQMSSEEYQNFFDEGQLGSKHLYQAPARLADAGTISGLSEYVKSGEINIGAINSGEEILVTYTSKIPPFEAGDRVTLYMSEAHEQGYGLGNITSAEVTVGAVLQITGSSPELLKKASRDSERDYNFLTTHTGALAMGAPSAAYSEAFAYEEVTGAPFPLSAELSVTSLKKLKREIFVNRMKKLGSIVLILILMSLLGFSAYFNGIGMKIRAKKYEVSVIRAVGTPVSAIRKRLMLASLKIPLIASAIAYSLIRVVQFVMEKLSVWYIEQTHLSQDMGMEAFNQLWHNISPLEKQELFKEVDALDAKRSAVSRLFFLNNRMWDPRAEIPILILLAVICAATFILTALALKKFKRNIAFDLNSGRTKQ